MRSRLEPMKKFVRTLRNHEDLLMNGGSSSLIPT